METRHRSGGDAELKKALSELDRRAAELKKLGAELARAKSRLTAETTERRRLEEALRSLPNQILEAQEAERRRIARDLHDGVNQILASAKLRLLHAQEQARGKAPALAESITQACQLLDRVLNEVRRISYNLRPSELDDFGLIAAVESMIREFEGRTKIRVEFQRSSLRKRLPADVELAFYRTLQEALANVEKHAGAKSVVISVISDNSFATLNIRDDGRGFRRSSASRSSRRGLGIIHMRERANALAGVFSIKSEPGEGVEISVHVKLLK